VRDLSLQPNFKILCFEESVMAEHFANTHPEKIRGISVCQITTPDGPVMQYYILADMQQSQPDTLLSVMGSRILRGDK
jgi:hypothetical protein